MSRSAAGLAHLVWQPVTGPPAHPEVLVDLTGQTTKPVACVAMVRRALQKAGHRDAALRFTDEALSSPTEALVEVARRYVTVVF